MLGIVELSPGKLVSERRYTIEQDLFLRDHTLWLPSRDGVVVLPSRQCRGRTSELLAIVRRLARARRSSGKQREGGEREEHPGAERPQVDEEEAHLDVRQPVVRRLQEGVEAGRAHPEDRPQEEAEEQVLEPPQRDVQEAPDAEVAADQLEQLGSQQVDYVKSARRLGVRSALLRGGGPFAGR